MYILYGKRGNCEQSDKNKEEILHEKQNLRDSFFLIMLLLFLFFTNEVEVIIIFKQTDLYFTRKRDLYYAFNFEEQ